MNAQPLIAVRDVEATSAWYQAVLGLQSGHGGAAYDQLMSEGRMVLQVHDWEADEHPHLGDPRRKPYGNGVVLWFQTDQFDQAQKRIEANRATVLQGPLVNPNANSGGMTPESTKSSFFPAGNIDVARMAWSALTSD